MASTWTAVADPHRRAVLSLLLTGPRSVGELTRELGLTQPGTSKHLRTLREAGLVRVRADAQRRMYELDPGPLAELNDWLVLYRRFWDEHPDALGRHLAHVDARHGQPDARHDEVEARHGNKADTGHLDHAHLRA